MGSRSSWSATSLTRHKPVILALTAVVLGCTLYYFHNELRPSANVAKPNLRRSNARRQRRRESSRPQVPTQVPAERARYVIDAPWGSTPIDLAFLRDPEANQEVLAQHLFRSSTGQSISTPLARHLPSLSDILQIIESRREARIFRRELEESFLSFYFWRHMPPSPITSEQQDILTSELQRDGDYSEVHITTALLRHQEDRLTQNIEEWVIVQERRRQEARDQDSQTPRPGVVADLIRESLEGGDAVMDDESDHSWRGEKETDDGKETGKEGQSLLNLLYRIAEEQARKDGYVHRRVTCNSCNMMPIRGIRYHCANCLDYDLCEQCEAMQIHPKTHLFYKIRIPVPFIRNPRQPEPPWYPGKPAAVNQTLEKDTMATICKETGYQVAEVEALWEQFRCLAATEWLDDPGHYYLAIDRQTFNKCFIPQASLRPPPPNLIYDRMFSFYDTDGNDLIGFQEFIHGLASLTKKNPGVRQKRLFKGFDINKDGFVDRKDFLRMFRAYYGLTRELTRDVLAAMEDDVSENEARDIVLGSQPISSAFTSAIPRGEDPRAPQGKFQNSYGDYTIFGNMRAVDNTEQDFEDPDETLADATEMAQYSNIEGKDVSYKDCASIYDDPWPSPNILVEDVEKVLAPAVPAEEVTLPEDQKAIRRVAHARIANNWQRRSFTRRKAVRDRKQRQSFYLDGEGDATSNAASESHRRDFGPVARTDSTRTKNLQRLVDAHHSEKFYAVVKEKIEGLEWPVRDSTIKLSQEIGEMILFGWKGIEIVEDLSCYAMDSKSSRDFVTSISDSLEEIVKELGLGVSIEAEMPVEKSLDSFPSSRRSRSSSKVRFQEDLGTDEGHGSRSRATSISSRSIPVNERWGGYDMPEPEKDVGREVLYQVTQEAFNELLDPIFRLREDLALAALQTRRMRDKHRADIIAAVDHPFFLKRELDMYQRWWRTEPFKEIDASGEGPIESDEAATFFTFLVQRLAGEKNSLTDEKCSHCARKGEEYWIGIGEFCKRCSSPSRIAREVREEQPTTRTPCSNCAEKGEESYLHAGANFCPECGHPSPQFASESAWLQGIISGRFSQPAGQAVSTNEGKNIKNDANQGSKSIAESETALELEGHVAVSNDVGPPSLEEYIAIGQRRLEELGLISGGLRSPDPTLPQNRPIRVSLADAARILNESANSITPPDPTLPQRSHNSPTPVETETTNNITPPDPTLPQHRPNSTTSVHHEITESIRLPDLTFTPTRLYSRSPPPDPTLPQNRSDTDAGIDYVIHTDHAMHRLAEAPMQPGSTASPAALQKGPQKSPPDLNTLRYWAALDMIEAEDTERGGPGRLNFKEWEQVMKGEKGKALGFLGTWIDMASF